MFPTRCCGSGSVSQCRTSSFPVVSRRSPRRSRLGSFRPGTPGNLGRVSAEIEIEVLWWEGCPSTDRARELMRAGLDELGLDSVLIRMVEVRTDADARDQGFRGSPTILINGIDLVELAGGEDVSADQPGGLSCRLYRRRDGRISPTPDPADVRAALAVAVGRARAAVTGELA